MVGTTMRRIAAVLSTVACAAGAPHAQGWTDLVSMLVPSDGTRSLGDIGLQFNDQRDQGSKIVFFDRENGDNDSAEVYWWDGTQLIDSIGSPTNASGQAYGTDPLHPNENAIRPFRYPIGVNSSPRDPRLRTHRDVFGVAAAGYADWWLLRRGQNHDAWDSWIDGGYSAEHPFVIAAYGPLEDGRAMIDLDFSQVIEYHGDTVGITAPFGAHNHGADSVWYHKALVGLDLRTRVGNLGTHWCYSLSPDDSVPTLLIEDCRFVDANLVYLPRGAHMRRSISMYSWDSSSHNQGYFNSGFKAAPTFDEVIFYKNGYNNDPMVEPDPDRDIYSRNIYQGGGAQMGHTYRNIISADGGSGGPQMRLGGLCENSLVIEGYWYSGTSSNSPNNEWLVDGQQAGRSAIVRNNVQLIFKYPSPVDPDNDSVSDSRSQPGWGYTLQGASFGAVIENNIVSHALLTDELGFDEANRADAFKFGVGRNKYQDSLYYTQQYDTIRHNIGYRTSGGLGLTSDWTDVVGHLAENNVFVANSAIHLDADNLTESSQLQVRNNRFYANDSTLPAEAWMGSGNTLAAYDGAAAAEGWPDPDRTLKRYVTEELNLTLLDWSDEIYFDPAKVSLRSAAGNECDPTGLRTFMAVATNMRRGGTDPIPTSGKPAWDADYPWDVRFTAISVVNWIREGFGMEPILAVGPSSKGVTRVARVSSLTVRPRLAGGYEFVVHAAAGVRVSVAVHDLAGRIVSDLGSRMAGPGGARVLWDGSGKQGRAAARQMLVVVATVEGGARVAQHVLSVR